MAGLPDKKISKIKVDSSNTYDIIPTMLQDGNTNNKLSVPTLTEDSTIALTSQLIASADWEEVQMITFTVQNIGTWSVPVGTTWGNLNTCYSSTNSSHYITGNTLYFIFNNSPQSAGTISTNGQNSGDVSLTDVIVNGTTYYARTAQSGGADN